MLSWRSVLSYAGATAVLAVVPAAASAYQAVARTARVSETVNMRTKPSAAAGSNTIGNPVTGADVSPPGTLVDVYCWHDGGTARINAATGTRVGRRWFLVIDFAQGREGWMTTLAFDNQPRVGHCVVNRHWERGWAPSASAGEPPHTPPQNPIHVRCGNGVDQVDPTSPLCLGTGDSPCGPGNTSAGCPSAPTPGGDGGHQPGQITPTPGGGGSITASKGGPFGCGNCFALNISVQGFPTGTYTYECHDNSGPGGSDTVFFSHAVAVTDSNQSIWPGVFCDDNTPYTAYLVMNGVRSNDVSFAAGAEPQQQPQPSAQTWAETAGGVAHTWTNPANAGGSEGPSIASNQTVQIACKIPGFAVADGNTWWYRIASDPWSGAYYVSADAFYNNGQTSGSLHGTPFVDGAIGDC